MKIQTSVYWRYWRSIIFVGIAVVFVGISWNLAVADGALPSCAGATVPTPQAGPASAADARAPALPFGVSEVLKLYQGGISKDFIVGYIENSVLPFHLTADGAIYLQHLGVPQEVISALIQRDGELQRQSVAAYHQQQQQAAANNQVLAGNPAPSMTMPGTPPPAVSYAYPDASAPVVYPDYATYPYYGYGYPYFYGPEVIIGGGFGFRHGFGGRGGRDRAGRGGFGGVGRGGFGGGHAGGHGGGHR